MTRLEKIYAIVGMDCLGSIAFLVRFFKRLVTEGSETILHNVRLSYGRGFVHMYLDKKEGKKKEVYTDSCLNGYECINLVVESVVTDPCE